MLSVTILKKSVIILFGRICGTLVHYSSDTSFSKKCDWFYTSFYHDKQITCVGSPTIHILNWTVESFFFVSKYFKINKVAS